MSVRNLLVALSIMLCISISMAQASVSFTVEASHKSGNTWEYTLWNLSSPESCPVIWGFELNWFDNFDKGQAVRSYSIPSPSGVPDGWIAYQNSPSLPNYSPFAAWDPAWSAEPECGNSLGGFLVTSSLGRAQYFRVIYDDLDTTISGSVTNGVPEPGALSVILTGLGGIAAMLRRRVA